MRYLSISAFISTLPISAISAEWSMSEDFTATTDTAVNQELWQSEDTFTGSLYLYGNGNSIIADGGDEDTPISGVRPTGWVATAVITGVGDISNLDMYNEDGSLKYNADNDIILANEEGFVGLSGAIVVNGNLTLTDSVIMNSLSHPYQNDYASGVKVQSGFYVDGTYFLNNASSAFRANNAIDGSYINNSFFYNNETGITIALKSTLVGDYYDNYTTISGNDFQYNGTSVSLEGVKATLTENLFTNNIDTGTLLYMKNNALVNATDNIFNDNIVYNGVQVLTGSTLNISSASFKSNTATNSLFYVTGVSTSDGYVTADVVSTSNLNLSYVSFEGNDVSYGLYIGSGANADLSNFTITDNTSTKAFINVIGSTTSTLTDESTVTNYSSATINNLTVKDNTSLYRLVSVEQGASLIFENSTVSNNTFSGAFAYIAGTSEDIISTATFTNITYSDNSGDSVNSGIGINMGAYSDVLIKDSTFTNNGSSDLKYGSVVQATGGTLTMDNVWVEGNLSLNGAIVTNGTQVTIKNSDFIGNSGTWGGVMRVQNATIIDTLFQDNVNTGNGLSGGVLYFNATASGLTDNLVTFSVVDRDMKYSGNIAGSSGFATIITQSADDALAAGDDAVIATLAFDISEDRTLEIGSYTVTADEIRSDSTANANQTIEKNGDGTLIINSYMRYYYGDLDVNAGSLYINKTIGAQTITVAEDAMLAIRVGDTSSSSERTFYNSTSTTIENSGTLIIAAAAGINQWTKDLVVDGATLSIVGKVAIVYGGTIDYEAYTYIASTATTVSVLGNISSTTIAQNGIIRYNDSDSNVILDIQFNSADEFTMSMLEGIDVSNNDFIEEAYTLYVSGLSETDSALISLLIDDTTLSINDLNIYRMESNEWVVVDDSLDYLQYDGQYLSFITDDLSSSFGWGYATVVPEPSTYAIIAGALALGFAMYRRRK